MKKVVLANGLKVIYQKRTSPSVVIQIMIKVGSNHEKKDEQGLAHFLEHILFEGTAKRPSNLEITNEIEKIGGIFNAYTTNERTCFYIKVLKKDFSKAIDVLADILQNSLFDEQAIDKEKKIILKEIDMVDEEPKLYQWVILQKHLFKGHPTEYPTYGSKKIINNLNRKELISFYNRYYTANNIVISIVGKIPFWKRQIIKNFKLESGKKSTLRKTTTLTDKNKIIKINKSNLTNSYLSMGFKTVDRNHPDSYVLEVINAILGKGQSGKIFTEIRSKRGLAYDIGTQHVSEASFGYFSVYATIDKKNVQLVHKLIMEEIEKLKYTSDSELLEAQNFIEGDFTLELEESQKLADHLLLWEQVKDARLINDFVKKIKEVNQKDINHVVDKYLKKGITLILQKK